MRGPCCGKWSDGYPVQKMTPEIAAMPLEKRVVRLALCNRDMAWALSIWRMELWLVDQKGRRYGFPVKVHSVRQGHELINASRRAVAEHVVDAKSG